MDVDGFFFLDNGRGELIKPMEEARAWQNAEIVSTKCKIGTMEFNMSWKGRKRDENWGSPVGTGSSQEDRNLAESLDFQWVTTTSQEHQKSSSAGGADSSSRINAHHDYAPASIMIPGISKISVQALNAEDMRFFMRNFGVVSQVNKERMKTSWVFNPETNQLEIIPHLFQHGSKGERASKEHADDVSFGISEDFQKFHQFERFVTTNFPSLGTNAMRNLLPKLELVTSKLQAKEYLLLDPTETDFLNQFPNCEKVKQLYRKTERKKRTDIAEKLLAEIEGIKMTNCRAADRGGRSTSSTSATTAVHPPSTTQTTEDPAKVSQAASDEDHVVPVSSWWAFLKRNVEKFIQLGSTASNCFKSLILDKMSELSKYEQLFDAEEAAGRWSCCAMIGDDVDDEKQTQKDFLHRFGANLNQFVFSEELSNVKMSGSGRLELVMPNLQHAKICVA